MPRFATAMFVLALGAAPAATFGQRSSSIQFHGIPGSVTSPRPDGTFRGISGSVTDPTFNGVPSFRVSGNFGRSRGGFDHDRGRGDGRHRTPVFVPYYYGNPYYYDSSQYTESEEPQQPAQPPVQVIVVKEEPSRSSDDSRYGEHYFDDHDSNRQSAHDQIAQAKPTPAPPDEPVVMTTLIYRDGHKAELRNYAIVGSNLIDLSKGQVLKKIPLASLDLDATRKENEDNGVDFRVP